MSACTSLEVSERQFQQAVIQMARHLGWSVWHHHDSRRQAGGRLVGDLDAKGWPDLALARDRLLLRELKTEKGRLSREQQQTIDTLKLRPAVRAQDLRQVLVHRIRWRPPEAAAADEAAAMAAGRIVSAS